MPTKKKTTKKSAKTPNQKRSLTKAERDKIRKYFQTFMPYLVKLRDNENIDKETRGVIKKMHKCLIDALNYSANLDYLMAFYQ